MEKYSQMVPFNHLTYTVSRHSGAIPEKPSAVAFVTSSHYNYLPLLRLKCWSEIQTIVSAQNSDS